ncbi:MAG TPA: hypothetical protein VE650_06275 [Acetobacteraceae bacterium]|nr:hypothetical protein [Acetobacteraceae bacterium]
MAGKDDSDDDKGGGAAMDLSLLKRALARSRRAKMNAAIGLADPKSGGQGLILIDKAMPPRKVMTTLKEQFPKATKVCFGTASVDMEADPKLVTFRMNKRLPGLDRRLRKALKGTGYSKVAIETGQAEEE